MFGSADTIPQRGDTPPGRRWPQATSQPRHWARARAENPLSRFVPFSSLVSPNVVITRGGDYFRVWRLDGVPFECADEHTIAERHEAKCSLLRNLVGGQFAVWEHRLHRLYKRALGIESFGASGTRLRAEIAASLLDASATASGASSPRRAPARGFRRASGRCARRRASCSPVRSVSSACARKFEAIVR